MRIFLLVAIAILALIKPEHASADDCADRVTEISRNALADYGKAKDVVIAASQFSSSIEEFADVLCARTDTSPAELRDDLIGKVMERYVGDIIDHGRPPRVGAIVSEVFDAMNAIARPDRRQFAVLNIECPSPIADSHVDIADNDIGTCGDKFIVDAGKLALRVRSADVAMCAGDVEVAARAKLACSCSSEPKPPSLPAAFVCK